MRIRGPSGFWRGKGANFQNRGRVAKVGETRPPGESHFLNSAPNLSSSQLVLIDQENGVRLQIDILTNGGAGCRHKLCWVSSMTRITQVSGEAVLKSLGASLARRTTCGRELADEVRCMGRMGDGRTGNSTLRAGASILRWHVPAPLCSPASARGSCASQSVVTFSGEAASKRILSAAAAGASRSSVAGRKQHFFDVGRG
jgi:hypothetical protein